MGEGKFASTTTVEVVSLCSSLCYRDCIEQIGPEPLVYEALLPSGEIVQTLLQFVWTLWEDPIDVSTYEAKLILASWRSLCYVDGKMPMVILFLQDTTANWKCSTKLAIQHLAS